MNIEMKFKLADRARRPNSTGPRRSPPGFTTVLLVVLAAVAAWRSGDVPPVTHQPPPVVTQAFSRLTREQTGLEAPGPVGHARRAYLSGCRS